MTDATIVYTDGACSGNPGPGGWAWAVPHADYASGAESETTNQRMELHAVLDAVQSLEGPLHVMSDSAYVVNCFRDRWWEGWIARDWRNSARKPVANRDLWEPLVAIVRSRRITFEWVKGHSGDRWNDLVDQLAVEAARNGTGRRGHSTPDLADTTAERSSPRPRRDITGHPLVVFGPRPERLGGYDENPLQADLRGKLAEIFSAKAELLSDLVVVTGMSLGTEMLAAEAAAIADVPYVAVLAFPAVSATWPEATRSRFDHLLEGARNTVILQRKTPSSRQAFAPAFARRDAWLRRNAAEGLVVWDGDDPVLGKTYRSLVDVVGEEQVWIVDPGELDR